MNISYLEWPPLENINTMHSQTSFNFHTNCLSITLLFSGQPYLWATLPGAHNIVFYYKYRIFSNIISLQWEQSTFTICILIHNLCSSKEVHSRLPRRTIFEDWAWLSLHCSGTALHWFSDRAVFTVQQPRPRRTFGYLVLYVYIFTRSGDSNADFFENGSPTNVFQVERCGFDSIHCLQVCAQRAGHSWEIQLFIIFIHFS